MGTAIRATLRDPVRVDETVQDLLEAEFGVDLIRVEAEGSAKREGPDALQYRNADLPTAMAGGLVGALLGAVVGALTATGTIDVAFLVAFLGRDLGGALLTGTIAGAMLGGLAGGILGMGWWRQKPPLVSDARRYTITVDAAGREDEARRILERHGARTH